MASPLRVLCRWKQELAPAAAVFVAVQITVQMPRLVRRPTDEEHVS
jgi:hypothetical protein